MPNSFPQTEEKGEFSYKFLVTDMNGIGTQQDQAWTSGPAPDSKGQFTVGLAVPLGEVPNLGFGRPDTFGEKEQALGTAAGMMEKGKDIVERLTKSSV